MDNWRASEASETLSGLNNENRRYMLLASERDNIRGNKWKSEIYLLASERSERAQSCSCSIEISDTYVYV